jgi:xeroderma pigmentosum group C-complementing protein
MPPFVARKQRRSPTPPPKVTSTKSIPLKSSAKRPSIFDTIDARPTSKHSLEENHAFLDSLGGTSDESSLSEYDSSDFEDVHPPKRLDGDSSDRGSDEEEVDWEDAIGPDISAPITPGPDPSGDLDLTLDKTKRLGSLTNPHNAKKGPSKIERQIRVRTHCMHVQYLLFHNLVRSVWICDEKVQDELVKGLPPGVLNEFKKWKSTSGIEDEEGETSTPNKSKGKGRAGKKCKGNKSEANTRSQRDWGIPAERLERGAPDLSRGDPTIRFVRLLSAWWKKRFRITAPGLRKQGYKPLEVLESEILSFQNDPHDAEKHGERIEDKQAFLKLARVCEGSRDVGAQLFTALLRGLGFEARLVCSLQPVGFRWSKSEEADLRQRTKSGKRTMASGSQLDPGGASDSDAEEDEEKEAQPLPVKPSKDKTLAETTRNKSKSIKGKGAKDAPIHLSDSESSEFDPAEGEDDSIILVTPSEPKKLPSKPYDKDLPVPIYWTEVMSPVSNRYIPVDALVTSVVASTAELLLSLEPRGAKAEMSKQVMAYVVAFSSDGTAKDVTTRYLKRHVWPGKTKGFRMPVEKVPVYNSRGKIKKHEEYDWFKTVMSGYTRDAKARTVADDLEEDGDLIPVKPKKEVKEGKEDTLQGYKTSAEFVLERHLRREEAIRPEAAHVKLFTTGKGEKQQEEKVFLRKDVLNCKTSESWHKEGREVRPGEQPMKLVPMRAVTLTRKREVAEAEAEGGKAMQGLYSKGQTEWIIPPPIVNGQIPRNAYNNIDCFVPTMVPRGAVHLPYRGTAKICKRLNIDFAEAVTGFEFGKQRAVPVVEGVVIAEENEEMIMDAWEIDEDERRKKEEGKREKEALALWRKLLMGLRIIERVRQDYGGDENEPGVDEMNPFTNRRKKPKNASNEYQQHIPSHHDGQQSTAEQLPAGFIREEDDRGQVQEGGFIVEDDRPAPTLLSKTRTARPTTSSTDPERINDNENGSSDSSYPDNNTTDTYTPVSTSKFSNTTSSANKTRKNPSVRTQTATPPDNLSYKAPPVSKGNLKTKAKPGRKRKRAASASASASASSSSDPSKLSSDTTSAVEAEKEQKQGRKRAKSCNISEPTMQSMSQTTPKKKAARRSETALKSHYFEQDVDEDQSGAPGPTEAGGNGKRKRNGKDKKSI